MDLLSKCLDQELGIGLRTKCNLNAKSVTSEILFPFYLQPHENQPLSMLLLPLVWLLPSHDPVPRVHPPSVAAIPITRGHPGKDGNGEAAARMLTLVCWFHGSLQMPEKTAQMPARP